MQVVATNSGECKTAATIGVSAEQGLLSAARKGDSAAFEGLCQPHSRKIFLTLKRLTRNNEDAEDALQDAMLSAFVHLPKFDGRSSFATWLTRIAINSGLMILRKNRSHDEISIDRDNEANFDGYPIELPDHGPGPEVSCAKSETEVLLKAAVTQLRPAVRKVIEIHQLQEHSMKETASALGITIAATKGRLFHGRRLLRRKLRFLAPGAERVSVRAIGNRSKSQFANRFPVSKTGRRRAAWVRLNSVQPAVLQKAANL
jgi:RNA polymerase sigma-70 factor (ECF subfamily)